MTLFTRTEYLDRVRRVKASMVKRGLDTLLVASPANQYYLTGYDGWSFYTPQMVVVSLTAEEPLWIGRAMDAVGAKFTAFLAPENVRPYPDNYVASTERHPMDFVVAELQSRGQAGGRIGVEMDDYYYTARWHQILTEGLPDANLVDAFLLVNWVRLTKSPAEIAIMHEAGKIATAAMYATIEAAAVGVRQCDVMAETYRVTTGGTDEIGGTFTCKPPNAMVGEYCSAPHLSWTDERLKPDDIFYVELGGCRHRYHSPLSRCIYLGEPTAEMARIADVIAEGLAAVIDKVRPGVTCSDLADTWTAVISRHGIKKDSRIGYPVGIGYPPTWGELTCSFRAGDTTVLQEGMSFHCIPAIWMETFGLVISESFVVTESGANAFTEVPHKLFTKQV